MNEQRIEQLNTEYLKTLIDELRLMNEKQLHKTLDIVWNLYFEHDDENDSINRVGEFFRAQIDLIIHHAENERNIKNFVETVD
jgi:hypothetical protein